MAVKIIVAVVGVIIAVLIARGLLGSGQGKSPSAVVLTDAIAVARRAMCLGAIMARANLEHELLAKHDEGPAEDRVRFARNQKAGTEEQGLWESLSSRERSLLEKPLGTWSEQEIADGEWRKNSAVVLLWALGKGGELLPYDQEADDLTLPPFDDARKFVGSARLRESGEIKKGRQVAELWLWRARTTQLQMEHVEPPKGMTFETIIAITAEGSEHNGFFKAVGKDFPAHGKPYAQLTEDEVGDDAVDCNGAVICV